MTDTSPVGAHRGNPLRIVIWGAAAFLLLLPWIAMQFTSEVNWDRSDFIIFGIMLLVVCGTYELGTRMSGNRTYRMAVGVALLGIFLLIWVNLAVGIIGNESNPANQVFIAVPMTALVGALIVRFDARGMARTLVATAIVQALISVVALIAGWGYIFVITALFVAVWLTSAHLFRKAARN